MTRKQAKELLPVIQAFAEGKTIQIKTHSGWGDMNLDYPNFNDDSNLYRIKPDPREFWIAVYKSSCVAYAYDAKADAKVNQGTADELIKVREVLE